MSVVKIIEVMSESTKSWEDATRTAVARAAKSVDGITSAWVKDQSVKVENGEVKLYRVTLKITFEIK